MAPKAMEVIKSAAKVETPATMRKTATKGKLQGISKITSSKSFKVSVNKRLSLLSALKAKRAGKAVTLKGKAAEKRAAVKASGFEKKAFTKTEAEVAKAMAASSKEVEKAAKAAKEAAAQAAAQKEAARLAQEEADKEASERTAALRQVERARGIEVNERERTEEANEMAVALLQVEAMELDEGYAGTGEIDERPAALFGVEDANEMAVALLQVERAKEEEAHTNQLIEYILGTVEKRTQDDIDGLLHFLPSSRQDYEQDQFEEDLFSITCLFVGGDSVGMQVSRNTTVDELRCMIAQETMQCSDCLHLLSPLGNPMRPFTSQLGKHHIADGSEVTLITFETDELDTILDSVYFPKHSAMAQHDKHRLLQIKGDLSSELTRWLVTAACQSEENALQLLSDESSRSERTLRTDILSRCAIDDTMMKRLKQKARDIANEFKASVWPVRLKVQDYIKQEVATLDKLERSRQLRADSNAGSVAFAHPVNSARMMKEKGFSEASITASRWLRRQMQNRNYGFDV